MYSVFDTRTGRTFRTVRDESEAIMVIEGFPQRRHLDYDQSRFALRNLTDQSPRVAIRQLLTEIIEAS